MHQADALVFYAVAELLVQSCKCRACVMLVVYSIADIFVANVLLSEYSKLNFFLLLILRFDAHFTTA